MTDESLQAAEEAFEAHAAFAETADGFEVSTSPFGTDIRVSQRSAVVEYRIQVTVPTLNSIVVDEEVATVVEEGWFETFERRLEDIDGVARVEPSVPQVEKDATAKEITVETKFTTPVPNRATEDIKALVDFVEGTYMEGVIPGYVYREPVASMLERAHDRSTQGTHPT